MAEKPKTTLPGTVEKIIPRVFNREPEKAQIAVEGAEDLYKEIRIENKLTDESGQEVRLKLRKWGHVEADPGLPSRMTLARASRFPCLQKRSIRTNNRRQLTSGSRISVSSPALIALQPPQPQRAGIEGSRCSTEQRLLKLLNVLRDHFLELRTCFQSPCHRLRYKVS